MNQSMNNTALPDTLHETLALAIEDAAKLDRKLYRPHYFYWHSLDLEKCLVCLAGCIVAGSLNSSSSHELVPCSFSFDIDRKLQAVNACRTGDWNFAFHVFHRRYPSIESQSRLETLPLPDYINFDNWQSFDSHLRSIQKILPLLAAIEIDALRP